MISVPVQSLKPGRILAADAKNAHGQLLIRKGMEVTDRHMRVLKSWGVVEVQIEGDPTDAADEMVTEQYSPEILERARVEVMERMSHNSIEHPAIDELVRICVNRRARQMSPITNATSS